MFATICNDDYVFQEKCKEWDAINQLVARVSGLFIWAATVVKFVYAFPAKIGITWIWHPYVSIT